MEQGIVTSVNYKQGLVFCNVRPVRLSTEYTDVPVLKPHSGFVQSLKEGEMVLMEKFNDGSRFIISVLDTRSVYPKALKEGEITIQLDDQTKIQFKEKRDGNYNLSISSSGDLSLSSSGDIKIDAGNDVNIDATGGVYINGTKFNSHDHDYTWTDKGGSGTTDPPN